MSLSEQVNNKQRASAALGLDVDVAVVAYRYFSPSLISTVFIFASVAAGLVFDPTWKMWLAVGVPAYLGLWLLVSLTRPTVILTRIRDRIVVLRPSLLRSTKVTSHVLAEYDLRTPTAIGPASWGWRPLMISYHRYWVNHSDGEATEQLIRDTAFDTPH